MVRSGRWVPRVLQVAGLGHGSMAPAGPSGRRVQPVQRFRSPCLAGSAARPVKVPCAAQAPPAPSALSAHPNPKRDPENPAALRDPCLPVGPAGPVAPCGPARAVCPVARGPLRFRLVQSLRSARVRLVRSGGTGRPSLPLPPRFLAVRRALSARCRPGVPQVLAVRRGQAQPGARRSAPCARPFRLAVAGGSGQGLEDRPALSRPGARCRPWVRSRLAVACGPWGRRPVLALRAGNSCRPAPSAQMSPVSQSRPARPAVRLFALRPAGPVGPGSASGAGAGTYGAGDLVAPRVLAITDSRALGAAGRSARRAEHWT